MVSTGGSNPLSLGPNPSGATNTVVMYCKHNPQQITFMKDSIKSLVGDQNYIKALRVLVKMRQEFQEIVNDARKKRKEKQR